MQTQQLLNDYFGGNMAELARAINVTRQAIKQWGDTIPVERVLPICKALNWVVTPHQLREDIYPYARDAVPSRKAA